jgi:hypothetical protein
MKKSRGKTMGRPRKQFVPDPGVTPAPRSPRAIPPGEPGNRLLPVDGPEIEETDFGRVTSKWQRWRLVREGKLACVRIGRNVFLTEQAIADFIARGGSR